MPDICLVGVHVQHLTVAYRNEAVKTWNARLAVPTPCSPVLNLKIDSENVIRITENTNTRNAIEAIL